MLSKHSDQKEIFEEIENKKKKNKRKIKNKVIFGKIDYSRT